MHLLRHIAILFMANRLRLALLVLFGISLASCNGFALSDEEIEKQAFARPSPIPSARTFAAEEEKQEPAPGLREKYSFPAKIDLTKLYLFYLHGKIIEDQGTCDQPGVWRVPVR